MGVPITLPSLGVTAMRIALLTKPRRAAGVPETNYMSQNTVAHAILGAQNVSKSFGAQPILRDITLAIHEGERVGLIGRNGSGKSTLLNILAGRDTPDSGQVTTRKGLRIGLLTQESGLDRSKTVGQVLEDASRELRLLLDEHASLLDQIASGGAHEDLQQRYETLHHTLELSGAWDVSQEIKRIRQDLALPPDEAVLSTLSGGELRRLDLAAVLLTNPDVLLLDEPTNHIDTGSVEWIEEFLRTYRGTSVLVTHDRYFLDQAVTRIVEIEFNRLYSFPGNYERFLEYKLQIQEVQARTEDSRQGTLRRELAWLRRGPKARGTKQKARIKRYEALDDQGPPPSHAQLSFAIPEPPRLGKRVVETEHLGFGFDGRPLIRDFSFHLQKGMWVGVIGPNGSGKTTLLELLMGHREPKQGKVLIGDTTQFLYVDQAHAEVDPEQTILGFVSNGAHHGEVNGRRIHIPGYLEGMLFDRESIHMPMKNLSGGERNRIQLARKLLQGGNVLVLDEPTNDLDLATLRILEDAVLAFDGAAMIVSHDRYFLNRLCTHVIVFEGDGRLTLIAGAYDDYLLYKEKTADSPAAESRPERSSAPDGKSSRAASGRPARLSYHDKQELATIESAIEHAEGEVLRFETVISEPGFYEQDYTLVQQTLTSLEAAKAEVERLYARWEDLDERRNAQ